MVVWDDREADPIRPDIEMTDNACPKVEILVNAAGTSTALAFPNTYTPFLPNLSTSHPIKKTDSVPTMPLAKYKKEIEPIEIPSFS